MPPMPVLKLDYIPEAEKYYRWELTLTDNKALYFSEDGLVRIYNWRGIANFFFHHLRGRLI